MAYPAPVDRIYRIRHLDHPGRVRRRVESRVADHHAVRLGHGRPRDPPAALRIGGYLVRPQLPEPQRLGGQEVPGELNASYRASRGEIPVRERDQRRQRQPDQAHGLGGSRCFCLVAWIIRHGADDGRQLKSLRSRAQDRIAIGGVSAERAAAFRRGRELAARP